MIVLAVALLTSGQEPVVDRRGRHAYVVSSASMSPSLMEGEVVMADRARGDCGTTEPSPGDVVIIDEDGAPWIRRVVAGPGQTVQVIDGVLHIDGMAVARRQVEAGRPALPEDALFPSEATQVWRETLANGRSYLTLDYGPGQMMDDTPPLVVPEGRWFTLGDNRDNAVDDRIDGPTPAEDLCGVVTRILRSDNPERFGTRP